MPRGEQTSDLANRLAGWFFVALGFGILCFAVAIDNTFAPERPVFVWVLGIVALVAVLFGTFAPRNLRASVLGAVMNVWL
jgi:hypothetical protein